MEKLNFGQNAKMVKTQKFYKTEKKQDVRIFTFNLPAVEACPGAGACKQFCYATQGRFLFSTVSKPREENFSILKGILSQDISDQEKVLKISTLLQNGIVETFTEKRLLKNNVRNIIRIHDSGDFFHKLYFTAWCNALQTLKYEKGFSIEAYAYTKSLPIVQRLFFMVPNNLHIIQSVGGLYDDTIIEDKPHSKVFKNEIELIAAGYVNGSETDIAAIEKESRIGLIYHGIKSLKKVQQFFA
jgi:hypothetical protein